MSRRNRGENGRTANRQIRCGIYTRKSTEEGLDKDFNSLDAQYEACEAFISSQRHEGWSLVPCRYDDGGFSGGNMDRPGLRQLLTDVQSGRVDVIVVYKVDRLTRSLTDFAKIVEVLDGAGASFVSITQSFNTTTSMGRLTLNVLLSFAQFEREVISERVRDKIAASKAKGMWMGGTVPLGYDARERKLLVNEAEAETVRHIFRRYLALGSVRALMADLDRAAIRTKRQHMRDGSARGELPFTRGPLYHLLKNRIYLGEITHHEKVYPGEHDPIIDRSLFDEVQALLTANAADRSCGRRAANPSLLAGMIRDGQDRPLSPVHATKGKVRYRYYATNVAVPGDDDPTDTSVRLPAPELERAIRLSFAAALEGGTWLQSLQPWMSADAGIHALAEQARLADEVRTLPTSSCRELLLQLDFRIQLEGAQVIASCSAERLAGRIGLPDSLVVGDRVRVPVAGRMTTRGKQARLLIEPPGAPDPKRDARLVRLLVAAHRARSQLLERAADRDAADAEQRRDLTRQARLSYLGPEITTAILDGRQPQDLTTRKLKRVGELPLGWSDQRRLLGFR